MKNSKTKFISIIIILTVIFNVVCFVLPVEKSDVFWISYIFGMIAIISQIGVVFFAWDKANSLNSKFFGLPIIVTGFNYLLIQLLSSLLFIVLIAFDISIAYYIPLILNVLILGLTLTIILSIDYSREEINRIDEKVKKKVNFINKIKIDVQLLEQQNKDNDLNCLLKDLSEKIKYSDPMSNESLESLEIEIETKIKELYLSLNKENILEIINLVEIRNLKTKSLK